MRVANHIGQVRIEPLDNFYAMALKVIRAQLNSTPQDKIQLNWLALWRRLPRHTQQVLNDLLGTLRFLLYNAQIFARAFRKLGVFQQQIGEAQNGGGGIVYFMRGAG